MTADEKQSIFEDLKQNNHKTEFEFEKVTESFIDAIYIEK
jgi:hypothetical protein